MGKNKATVTVLRTEQCDHENGLVERPASKQTYEQKWCGTWFDCPHCTFSSLIPSVELNALKEKMKKPE
jgi:hypothetical protein